MLELQVREEGLGRQTLAHGGQVQTWIHGDHKVGQECSVLSATDMPQNERDKLREILGDVPGISSSSQKLVSLS